MYSVLYMNVDHLLFVRFIFITVSGECLIILTEICKKYIYYTY